MATLAEVLAETSTVEYSYVDGYEVNEKYIDENVVEVSDRVIGDVNGNVSTYGEEKSQAITFRMSRFSDGIDITETGKLIKIHYELADGTGSDDAPVNVKRNDTHVILTWIIPAAATVTPSEIHFIIYVIGDGYIFKTLSKPYTINATLDIGGGLPEPDENWYVDFIRKMEAYVAQAESGFAAVDAAKESATSAAASASAAASSASEASTSANEVAQYDNVAKSYAIGATGTRAGEDTDNSKWYSQKSGESANDAKSSETAAKTSETNAKSSETASASSASAAKTSETNAKSSETAAKTSETNAKSSETASASSASAAKTSETNAKSSETASASSASAAKTSETNAAQSASDASQAASALQGVSSVKSQWYLSSSEASLVDGSWADIMPEITSGKYLWNRTFITYSNNTTVYSDPVIVTGINDLSTDIVNEQFRAETAESANSTAILNETSRAQAAEGIRYTKTEVDNMLSQFLLSAHPVGSLYWSSDNTSPATLFGGTWTQISDTFILAAGSSHAIGSSGGQESTSLGATNLPSFTASVSGTAAATQFYTDYDSHNHTMTDRTIYSGGGTYYAEIADSASGSKSGTSTNTHRHLVNSPAKSVTGTASYSGNATAFTNMPPFVTKYCWERTA